MALVITQPCIGVKDTACVAVCPVDCIHPTRHEAEFPAEEMLYIDPENCIDCGLCIDECPVRAIFPEADVPPEWRHFIEKNRDYYARPSKCVAE
jgi:ferredoxin